MGSSRLAGRGKIRGCKLTGRWGIFHSKRPPLANVSALDASESPPGGVAAVRTRMVLLVQQLLASSHAERRACATREAQGFSSLNEGAQRGTVGSEAGPLQGCSEVDANRKWVFC